MSAELADPAHLQSPAACVVRRRLAAILQKDPDVTGLRDRYLHALSLAESVGGERRQFLQDEARRLCNELGDLVLAKLGWAGAQSGCVDERGNAPADLPLEG
jgi:hypothetical protein